MLALRVFREVVLGRGYSRLLLVMLVLGDGVGVSRSSALYLATFAGHRVMKMRPWLELTGELMFNVKV